MDTRSYTTKVNFTGEKRAWLLVDAQNQTLGRLASKVAYLLRGKHKTTFTPHLNMGDHVVVINAEKVRLTGKKMTDKVYVRHTGYPGGQRYGTPKTFLQSKPTFIVERAVKKMLPSTKLSDAMLRNLHVFVGDKHEHDAQQPKAVDLTKLIVHNTK